MDTNKNSTLITPGVWDAVREANKGDHEALSLVEGMLSGPAASELLSVVGDMAYQAVESTLKMVLVPTKTAPKPSFGPRWPNCETSWDGPRQAI